MESGGMNIDALCLATNLFLIFASAWDFCCLFLFLASTWAIFILKTNFAVGLRYYEFKFINGLQTNVKTMYKYEDKIQLIYSS